MNVNGVKVNQIQGLLPPKLKVLKLRKNVSYSVIPQIIVILYIFTAYIIFRLYFYKCKV